MKVVDTIRIVYDVPSAVQFTETQQQTVLELHPTEDKVLYFHPCHNFSHRLCQVVGAENNMKQNRP